MIFVDRGRVPAPEGLPSGRVESILADARSFYRQPSELRAQQRFDFGKHLGWLKRQAGDRLVELFAGKCAFCESKVDSGYWEIEQLRPKAGSIGADGERSPDHYWWLAFEWRNLRKPSARPQPVEAGGEAKGAPTATARSV